MGFFDEDPPPQIVLATSPNGISDLEREAEADWQAAIDYFERSPGLWTLKQAVAVSVILKKVSRGNSQKINAVLKRLAIMVINANEAALLDIINDKTDFPILKGLLDELPPTEKKEVRDVLDRARDQKESPKPPQPPIH